MENFEIQKTMKFILEDLDLMNLIGAVWIPNDSCMLNALFNIGIVKYNQAIDIIKVTRRAFEANEKSISFISDHRNMSVENESGFK